MKKAIVLILTVLICCSVLMPINSLTASAAASDSVKEECFNSDKWLSLSKNTTGPRYFVDANGNPVNLFGTARCKYHQNEEDVLYTDGGDADVNSLTKHYANFGMNFMRLSIFPSELCGGEVPTDREIDIYLTEHVDPDVQAIIKSGMYVMIDLHLYPQQETKYKVQTASEIVNYARKYYIPILKGIARMYRDEPMVAVYELWNEPYPADQEDLNHNVSEWNGLLREYFIDAVNEIRKIDTKHVVMVSDFNAGWGMCTGVTWDGHYDRLDPVYKNTCFSTHIARDHVTKQWNSYYSWYKSYTNDKNICIVFGEIETEGDLMSTEGMQTLLNFFDETKDVYHFSGNLWRPHGWAGEYHELWSDNGWAERYCNLDPTPTAHYISEAEDKFGDKNDSIEIMSESNLFGFDVGNGITMKEGLSIGQFYESTWEAAKNLIYKEGKYKLMVRAVGKEGYDGDFIVGYRDLDGVVHQIARFEGKNTNGELYYQTVEFFSDKPIVSIVYFGCEDSKKSAVIDRIYIEGAATEKETLVRLRTDFADISKVIDLEGSTYNLTAQDGGFAAELDANAPKQKLPTEIPEDIGSNEEALDKEENSDKTTSASTTETKGGDKTIIIIIAAAVVVVGAGVVVAIAIIKKKKNAKTSDVETEEPKEEETKEEE